MMWTKELRGLWGRGSKGSRHITYTRIFPFVPSVFGAANMNNLEAAHQPNRQDSGQALIWQISPNCLILRPLPLLKNWGFGEGQKVYVEDFMCLFLSFIDEQLQTPPPRSLLSAWSLLRQCDLGSHHTVRSQDVATCLVLLFSDHLPNIIPLIIGRF